MNHQRCLYISNTLLACFFVLLLTGCGGGGGGANKTAAANGPTSGLTVSESTESVPSQKASEAASSIKAVSSRSSVTSTSSSKSSESSSVAAPESPDDFVVKSTYYDVVFLAWAPPPANSGVVLYKLYRDNVQIDTIDPSDTSYIDFNVAPGKTYTYGITAGNATNLWSPVESISAQTTVNVWTTSSSVATSSSSRSNSSASSKNSLSSAGASSSSSSADITAPSVPTNLTKVQVTQTKATFSWSASTDNVGVTAYKIYKNQVLVASQNASLLSYTDELLSEDTIYTFSVSAGDAAGNWSPSTPISIQTLKTVIATGTVNFQWSPPTQRENGDFLSSSEIAGYTIRYKPKTSISFLYTAINDGLAQTYTLLNLTGIYDFEIAVYDKNGVYSSFIPITQI